MKPTLQEQIEYMEGLRHKGEMDTAILTALRQVEAAERELPEEPINWRICIYSTEVTDYVEALRAYAAAQKVREHD